MMAAGDLETLTDAVTALTGEITGLHAEIQSQRVFAERSRTLIWRQWVIGGAVLLLVIWVGFTALSARHVAKLAQRNANRAVTQCETLNSEGLRQRQLWEKVIVNQPPARTPQEAVTQAAQVAQFRRDMDEAFVQQDCTKLPK